MRKGICKLCLEEKPLCLSHLIPSRLYRYCDSHDLPPIRFTAREIGHTTEELKVRLLCSKCENLLNHDGENWLVPKLATIEGSFPFYDLLAKRKPDLVEPDFVAYACAHNPNIGFRKLTNFVIGVFWKASVHSWREGNTAPRLELGRYREHVRLFLTHKRTFPANVALNAVVQPKGNAVIGFNLPELRQTQPCHQYFFHVPGITFILAVGRSIPEELKKMCFASNPLHPVLVADMSHRVFESVALGSRNAVRSAEVTSLISGKQS